MTDVRLTSSGVMVNGDHYSLEDIQGKVRDVDKKSKYSIQLNRGEELDWPEYYELLREILRVVLG